LAIDRVKSALALAPSDLNSYDVRAYADYFSGNYSAARESLKKLLGNPAAAEKSYSAIWLYLATRRLGEEGTEAARRHLPTAAAPSWPYPILQMFIGSGSYEQALKMAREGAQDPSRQCELYFYAGEKALLDGDLQVARDFFRKTIDTGVVEFNEYAMAKRRLEAPELK
jgi:lipoprotein NlpI